MDETFLRLPAVIHKTGFGRSQIYNLIKQGKFPNQIHLGPNSVAWLESEVSKWMEERIQISRNSIIPTAELKSFKKHFRKLKNHPQWRTSDEQRI